MFLSWLVKHKIKLQFFVTRFVYNMIWTAFMLMGAYCIEATETTFLIKRSTRSSKTEKRDYHEFKIFFVFSLWKNLYGQIKDVFDLIIITIIAFQDLHTNEDWLVAKMCAVIILDKTWKVESIRNAKYNNYFLYSILLFRCSLSIYQTYIVIMIYWWNLLISIEQ